MIENFDIANGLAREKFQRIVTKTFQVIYAPAYQCRPNADSKQQVDEQATNCELTDLQVQTQAG